MKYWFTADYHLGHANIIKYCNRPFKSLEEMDKKIIFNHNSRVKSDDIVFHIGDFCFKNTSNKEEGIRVTALQWEYQLNGKIIHIKGNHDKNNSTKTIIHNLVIEYGHKSIRLVHNPRHFDYRYDIHFVGHVHDKWQFQRIISMNNIIDLINVGVDVWDFMPITFDEIMKKYYKWRNLNGK